MGVQQKKANGSGAEGLGALFAPPVRACEVLDARNNLGIVIRFDDGLQQARSRQR